MIVLADEILLRNGPLSVATASELELPVASTSILGDIWSSIATDSNKKIFHMFTDPEIGNH